MHLGGVRPHTLEGKHCTTETYLGLPYLALATVEDDAILGSGLHPLHKVPVLLFLGPAKDTDVIVDCENPRKTVSDLVHLHLEDIMTHLQAKGHVQ